MKGTVVHNHPIHYKHLLFTELKRQGLDFDVVFASSGSSIRNELIPLSEDLYRSHIAWQGSYETSPAWRRFDFTWKKLRQLSPEVVIISSYYAAECWSAWLWALANRKPVIMWFESNEFDYPRHWPKEFLKRVFCRRVARAHVYGISNKEYLVKLGIPADRIDIKRAVVNVAQFATPGPRSYRSETESRRLLYVGRLAPEKNVDFLLRCFAAAGLVRANAPMEMVLAGLGPCEANLRAQAKLLGIENCVKFLGYVPQANLPKIYQTADFFVLPSTREPWGLVSLEAMLGRLPVLISSQCGCARDVVTPESGWAFSPYRVEELTALLAALPALPLDRVKAMGDAAFAIAREYTAANCAKVIIDSIGEALRVNSNSSGLWAAAPPRHRDPGDAPPAGFGGGAT